MTRVKRRKKTTETIALPKSLVEHLKRYIVWKKDVGQSTGKNTTLFIGKHGPMTSRGLQQIWKQAVRRAGLIVQLVVLEMGTGYDLDVLSGGFHQQRPKADGKTPMQIVDRSHRSSRV